MTTAAAIRSSSTRSRFARMTKPFLCCRRYNALTPGQAKCVQLVQNTHLGGPDQTWNSNRLNAFSPQLTKQRSNREMRIQTTLIKPFVFVAVVAALTVIAAG